MFTPVKIKRKKDNEDQENKELSFRLGNHNDSKCQTATLNRLGVLSSMRVCCCHKSYCNEISTIVSIVKQKTALPFS